MKLQKLKKKYIRYQTLIGRNQLRSLDLIAWEFPIDYNIMCNDLTLMIEFGYLPPFEIEYNTRELILPGENRTRANSVIPLPAQRSVPPQPALIKPRKVIPRTIKCKNCAALINTETNKDLVCEFCGVSYNL